MTKYIDIRKDIQTGDVLLCEGRGLGSIFIRVITGQQVNHVAVLINRQEAGIWVAEFTHPPGYQLMPASQWMEIHKKDFLYWGKAPAIVHLNESKGLAFADTFRDGHAYSFWTLGAVWWSQITRKKNLGNYVCSTFAQKWWEKCKFEGFTRLADPGDFMQASEVIHPLE